jgi:transcriptional regulator NrdR family protein
MSSVWAGLGQRVSAKPPATNEPPDFAIRCPECHSTELRVWDTRKSAEGTYRQRRCNCGQNIFTKEVMTSKAEFNVTQAEAVRRKREYDRRRRRAGES